MSDWLDVNNLSVPACGGGESSLLLLFQLRAIICYQRAFDWTVGAATPLTAAMTRGSEFKPTIKGLVIDPGPWSPTHGTLPALCKVKWIHQYVKHPLRLKTWHVPSGIFTTCTHDNTGKNTGPMNISWWPSSLRQSETKTMHLYLKSYTIQPLVRMTCSFSACCCVGSRPTPATSHRPSKYLVGVSANGCLWIFVRSTDGSSMMSPCQALLVATNMVFLLHFRWGTWKTDEQLSSGVNLIWLCSLTRGRQHQVDWLAEANAASCSSVAELQWRPKTMCEERVTAAGTQPGLTPSCDGTAWPMTAAPFVLLTGSKGRRFHWLRYYFIHQKLGNQRYYKMGLLSQLDLNKVWSTRTCSHVKTPCNT